MRGRPAPQFEPDTSQPGAFLEHLCPGKNIRILQSPTTARAGTRSNETGSITDIDYPGIRQGTRIIEFNEGCD